MYIPTVAELTMRLDVTEPPNGTKTGVGLTETVKAGLELTADRSTWSVNPPTLVSVRTEVPVVLGATWSEAGDASMLKNEVLEKVAPCVLSGSGVPVPFEMVTQVPNTLVLAQPVLKSTVLAPVVPTTLNMAVNKRPVVGGVEIAPDATAAKCRTPAPS